MFKKLFGNGQAKPRAQAEVSTEGAMEKIDASLEHTEKRAKVLEAKVRGLKMEALEKKKAKDTRGK